MISNAFKFTLLGLCIALGATSIFLLRKDSERLRQRLGDQRGRHQQSARLREENQRTQALISRLQTDEADGARVIHADRLRAQEEVAELEKRARLMHVQKLTQGAVDAEALANNRDPEKGLMRLEYFQNVGQETPSAALQTLVWAAMKGEDAALMRATALSEPARAKAAAFLASLPEEERARWTPEKMGALFVSRLITEVPSLQVLGATMENDGQHAALNVRLPSTGKEKTERIPMQRGSTGWQVILSEKQINGMLEKIRETENTSVAK